MAAADHYASAAELLVEEDYAGAVAEFTAALALDGKSVKALTGRAAAHAKLNRWTDCLQDSNAALSLDPSCEVAYYRKGTACFELDEFETALAAFQKGKSLLDAAGKAEPAARPYGRWIRKCEAEVEDDSDNSEDDYEDATMPPAAPNAASATATAPPAPTASSAPAAVVPETPSGPEPLNWQFYQSSSAVTLEVMEKKVQPDELTVTFDEQKVTVIVARAGVEVRC
jgi:suppressor of G2 allele of SKP1